MTPLYRVSEAVNDAEKYFPLQDYSAFIRTCEHMSQC